VTAANPIPLTVDGFIESAREFASEALDAYIARKFRRVALDAGTALEHLAKACLASRSPALLTELRGEGNFVSMLGLLGMTGSTSSTSLRTVSLRDALARVRKLVTSTASVTDLETLVDIRDGTVHAARSDELEERLVVTFVQHCDVLLQDLQADRGEFWGRQLAVVDALLADASDKVAHHVEVKLAAARARFEERSVEEHPELLSLARQVQDPSQRAWDMNSNPELCPACESFGVESGIGDLVYDPEDKVEQLVFTAESFVCGVCGLRLDSPAELSAAGVDPITRADVTETPPDDAFG
jgi:hypothetical protein